MNQATILSHYLVAALTFDASEENTSTIFDFDSESIEQAKSDISKFVENNKALLEESKLSDEQIGHDFWLTRQGHGAGFWDRDLGQLGDEITKNIEKDFVQKNVYELVDGKMTIE